MNRVFRILVILIFSVHSCLAQEFEVPEYAHVLSRYIQLESEQHHEKPSALYFMEECRKKGLYTEVLTPVDTAFNVIASLYPLSCGKPNIVFLNHLDVVPPGDTTLWKYPPYSGKITDSLIWGRGAIDMKGLAVAQLFAVAEFTELARTKDLPFNVSILAVSGEETDGHNGAELIANNFFEKINPVIMFGEGGTGVKTLIKANPDQVIFGVSTVEKSKIILQLDMEIKSSGHGSVPPKEYAMKEMIFALEKMLKKKPDIRYYTPSVRGLKTLGKYEKGIRGFVQRNFTFLFFRPFIKRQIKNDPVLASFFANTYTLTKLTIPEGTSNMISHHASAIFDCRLIPDMSVDRFIKNVHNWVDDPRVKIKVVSEIRAAPKTNSDEFFVILKKSIQDIYPDAAVIDILTPSTTDNNYFRSKGVPVYGIFPAVFTQEELESVHNINERVHFNEIEGSIEVYERMLEEFLNEGVELKKRRFKRIFSSMRKRIRENMENNKREY
jgi:carboxypeptidase PM20D1